MNRRILVIDDQEEVLKDYQEILSPRCLTDEKISQLEAELFGKKSCQTSPAQPAYEVYLARQGKEGYEIAKKMKEAGTPFAVAFIDMRMPPGWDGLETARRIREIDPEVEIVIITAYSDRDRIEIVEKLKKPSKLLYLKKPFDIEEIRQLALALTEKWNLEQKEKRQKELLKELLLRINQIKNLGLSDLDKLLNFIFNQMLNLLDADSGLLIQIDSKNKELNFKCLSGRFQSPELLKGSEMENLKNLILERFEKMEGCFKFNGYKLIPFYVVEYDRLVLVVENPKEELLDQELLRIFVENVSSAIDTAYIYERLYQSHRQLEEANRQLQEYQQDLERKIQERTRELHQLNELHKNIIDHAGIAILTIDEQGIIRSVNRTSKQILGYLPEEMIEKKVEEFHSLAREFFKILNQKPEQEFPWEREVELKKKSGESFPAHLTISRVKMSEPEKYFYVVLVSDLTERKKLENQLLQSQKLESIGTLAGGVAHNFNNLLLVILNSLQEIQERLKQDPELEFNLELIRKSAEQAKELTQQLLSFSRKKSSQKRPVKINEVIKEIGKLLGKTIHKNIEIQTELEENLPLILGDPALLQQALLNLGVNARDAMPHGGILRFEAHRKKIQTKFGELIPGEYIEIVVEDTGIGIPGEIKEHIFEPFFTTKGLEKGTGLGLATVYGIVRNHRGEIFVESEPGQGARFTILLPVPDEKELKSSEEKPAPLTGFLKGEGKILLIDDEEFLLKLAEIRLGKKGYQVLVARSGEEALKLIQENPDIRVVAMDMIMPGLSGKELFAEIKKLNPNLPIILISGYSYEGDAEELMEKGAIGYLQKPFIFDELVQIIEKNLARSPKLNASEK